MTAASELPIAGELPFLEDTREVAQFRPHNGGDIEENLFHRRERKGEASACMQTAIVLISGPQM
jgi:hypothetical protein